MASPHHASAGWASSATSEAKGAGPSQVATAAKVYEKAPAGDLAQALPGARSPRPPRPLLRAPGTPKTTLRSDARATRTKSTEDHTCGKACNAQRRIRAQRARLMKVEVAMRLQTRELNHAQPAPNECPCSSHNLRRTCDVASKVYLCRGGRLRSAHVGGHGRRCGRWSRGELRGTSDFKHWRHSSNMGNLHVSSFRTCSHGCHLNLPDKGLKVPKVWEPTRTEYP